MESSTEYQINPPSLETSFTWAPDHIRDFIGQLALIHNNTVIIPPTDIVRADKRTTFACSGVQLVYDQLFDGEEAPDHAQLIAQPVIRTQHLHNTSEGTSTSFVNFNLLMFDIDYDEHADRKKEFFEVMINTDQIGEDNHRIITEKGVVQNWFGTEMKMSENEKLWVNGIELGEAIYYGDIRTSTGANLRLSELAFGLERLIYASMNPESGQLTSYYSKELGGLDEPIYKNEELSARSDVIKSATLMAMSGVVPANKSSGGSMRKFIKRISEAAEDEDISEIHENIENSYAYWSHFISTTISLSDVIEILNTELDRNRNRVTLNRLSCLGVNVEIEINQDRDSFINQLIMSIGSKHAEEIVSATIKL